MSSMRNAVQRRNHKERSQPQERAKWGILEKHKDYSLRAKDYNLKKARLKALREKAALHNPDEFSYKMISSRTDETGRLITERGTRTLSQDVVRLLKTQDAGYLRTKSQEEMKRQEKLQQSWTLSEGGDPVALSGSGVESKRTVFLDNTQKRDEHVPGSWVAIQGGWFNHALNRFKRAEDEDSEATLPKYPEPTAKEIEARRIAAEEEAERGRLRDQTKDDMSRLLKLSQLRQKEFRTAEQELTVQRAQMGKSPTVGGKNRAGVTFKARERRR